MESYVFLTPRSLRSLGMLTLGLERFDGLSPILVGGSEHFLSHTNAFQAAPLNSSSRLLSSHFLKARSESASTWSRRFTAGATHAYFRWKYSCVALCCSRSYFISSGVIESCRSFLNASSSLSISLICSSS